MILNLFSLFFVPVFSVITIYVYINFASFSINSSYCFLSVFFDEYSFFLVYITCFVIFVSFMFCFSFISIEVVLVLVLIMLVSCGVFLTTNMLVFYFLYECSLVPILYIIINWGSYPERSVSSIMLLLYTSVFTFPFLYVILVLYFSCGSLSFIAYSNIDSLSLFSSIVIFLAFSVKLPIYGLHFWLPIAHVEAPTFGSMILAGILLKLGGVGLVRFACFMDFVSINSFFLGYFLVFLCYSTLLCCIQSDFNRLVAYSSISHIITVPLILLSSSFVGVNGLLSVMFLHGISSPVLFMLVGITYSLTFTRQHVLMRGIVCLNPLLSFLIVLAFFFSVSAPPFPSFVAEVFFAISAISIWFYSFLFILFFLFFSIVYSLLWLTSLVFLNQDSFVNYSFVLSYSVVFPLTISIMFAPVVFSILFSFA